MRRFAVHGVTAAECWASLLEQDLERRAEFYRWPHVEVDTLLDLGLKAFHQSDRLSALLLAARHDHQDTEEPLELAPPDRRGP